MVWCRFLPSAALTLFPLCFPRNRAVVCCTALLLDAEEEGEEEEKEEEEGTKLGLQVPEKADEKELEETEEEVRASRPSRDAKLAAILQGAVAWRE